jgi:hypothetical protein
MLNTEVQVNRFFTSSMHKEVLHDRIYLHKIKTSKSDVKLFLIRQIFDELQEAVATESTQCDQLRIADVL